MASLGGHRNIVRYYGGQQVPPGGFFWIVMEHMECGTLADVMALTGAPLAEGEVAAVLRDVCSGLGYLHNLGFLHKDIKCDPLVLLPRFSRSPLSGFVFLSFSFSLRSRRLQPHNILLGARAIAKLADFGVSQRAPDAEGDSEGAGAAAGRHAGGGTLAFMGPEVVRGQVCAKSDVWAVGVTAIHLLTRALPHDGLSDLQLAEAIVAGPPPRLPAGEETMFGGFVVLTFSLRVQRRGAGSGGELSAAGPAGARLAEPRGAHGLCGLRRAAREEPDAARAARAGRQGGARARGGDGPPPRPRRRRQEAASGARVTKQ